MYHFPLYIFCVIIYVIIFWCYHLCYHLMLSFFTVSKCYLFYVIIFPCTYFVLSFMLSFDVIIYCYHFPPFFFFLKTWHTPEHAPLKKSSDPQCQQVDWVFYIVFDGLIKGILNDVACSGRLNCKKRANIVWELLGSFEVPNVSLASSATEKTTFRVFSANPRNAWIIINPHKNGPFGATM